MQIQRRAAGTAVLVGACLLNGCSDSPADIGRTEDAAASIVAQAGSKAVAKSAFQGLYFPAGLEGTGTECPGAWVEPFFCVLGSGEWQELPGGRIRIRDVTLYELAFSWRGDDPGEVEPRKTGYDIVVANANLDASLSGPTWGTWILHDFAGERMFEGTFTGKFEDGIPAVRFVGKGIGPYAGQQMRGDIARSPDEAGYNMYGSITERGGS